MIGLRMPSRTKPGGKQSQTSRPSAPSGAGRPAIMGSLQQGPSCSRWKALIPTSGVAHAAVLLWPWCWCFLCSTPGVCNSEACLAPGVCCVSQQKLMQTTLCAPEEVQELQPPTPLPHFCNSQPINRRVGELLEQCSCWSRQLPQADCRSPRLEADCSRRCAVGPGPASKPHFLHQAIDTAGGDGEKQSSATGIYANGNCASRMLQACTLQGLI